MGAEAQIARPHRVVLDTNVAVSTLVFRHGRLAWLRQAWERGLVIPVVSAETVSEFVRVVGYPKFRLTEEETKDLLAHYMEHAEAVTSVSARVQIPECRDPDDRIFLRLAYAARVEALVTGDADLLVLSRNSRIPILAPDVFKGQLAL